MKLKNVLIVVDDIDMAIDFYKNAFGLKIVSYSDGNVILQDGLVLQKKDIWEEALNRTIETGSCNSELYFETRNFDEFLLNLKNIVNVIYLSKELKNSFGRRVIRILDPFGNMIEVGEE